MKLSINDNLNPICEILGLLYVSTNYDILMEKSIDMLKKNGINGELFIKNNLKILNKYIKEFRKHMIFEEENEFFEYSEEDENILFFIILGVVISEEEKLKNIDNMTEDEIRNFVLGIYYEILEESYNKNEIKSLKDILYFLEKQELSDKTKWKLMKLLSNSKENIKSVLKLIEENRDAYEKAYQSIEQNIIKSIDKNKKYIMSGKCEVINNISISDSDFQITPTLAFCMSIFELKNTFYVGILNEIIFNEQSKAMGNKGDLVLKLKALSDNSKLETIALLKKGPMYSSEIASNLNLTSATVSYHMSTLLEIGMVLVEKKQGKVYYNLNKSAMQKFIEDLNNILL